MRLVYFFTLIALVVVACGQGLNWRQVKFEGNADQVLLPCKPEQAQRKVMLGHDTSDLQMQGCEVQGMQSVSYTHLTLPTILLV